jgi:anti-sigma regulatory factor (Ser/Thr protein kinase)
MREIALHLLDIAENSVSAKATTVDISVRENISTDRLIATVHDNGKGMDAELLGMITDPFVTSRTTRKVGLGIPLIKAAAEACNGKFTIESSPGKGTILAVEFQHSHIDRMPLGDLAGTLLTLLIAYQDIRWVFTYEAVLPGVDEVEIIQWSFDSEPVREILGELPFSEPGIVTYLRSQLQVGIDEVQKQIATVKAV